MPRPVDSIFFGILGLPGRKTRKMFKQFSESPPPVKGCLLGPFPGVVQQRLRNHGVKYRESQCSFDFLHFLHFKSPDGSNTT